MDRIKKLKIKKQDGTFSDYIPIGADAENIDLSYNDSNVEDTLKKKPYYYDNVADMKADNTLKKGDMAITLGYYNINDGGGAEYSIVETDSGLNELLNNNLYARLILKNNEINIKSLGAYGDDSHDDLLVFQKVFNFLGSDIINDSALSSNRIFKYNLNIPKGRYLISGDIMGTGSFVRTGGLKINGNYSYLIFTGETGFTFNDN